MYRAMRHAIARLMNAVMTAIHTNSLIRWESWPISQTPQDYISTQCPSLRDVSVSYPNLSRFARTERTYRERGTFDLERPLMIPSPLPTFTNLRVLQLYGLSGDLNTLGAAIASTLHQSMHLQELGLSLSAECEWSYMHKDGTASPLSYYSFLNFLTLLIELYKSSGARPLRLKSLKLGYGVLLNDPDDADSLVSTTPISDLTDLSLLEELFLDNDLDVGCAISSRQDLGRVAWHKITSTSMPRLRRFSFTSLSERSRDWLGHIADSDFLNSLTLGVGTERLAYSFIRPEDGVIERVDSQSILRIGVFHEKTFFLKPYRHGLKANFPVRCQTLQLLKSHCIPADFAALGPCSWIRTLVVCFKKYLDIQALRKVVSLLPIVESLCIRIGTDYPLPNGGDETRHKGNAIKTPDGHLVDEQHYLRNIWRSKWGEIAAMIASSWKCPSKYLKVGHLAWRVLPRAKGASVSILESMDMWEEQAECPAVFQYNDPVRHDHVY